MHEAQSRTQSHGKCGLLFHLYMHVHASIDDKEDRIAVKVALPRQRGRRRLRGVHEQRRSPA